MAKPKNPNKVHCKRYKNITNTITHANTSNKILTFILQASRKGRI